MFAWLSSEGGVVLSWWALVTLAGVAVFPMCVRLLGGLPDKGYTLSRAVGLLVVGFVFWLLASLGFLRNTSGSMILSWLLVLGVSVGVYVQAGTAFDWRKWWRENHVAVIVAEVLFIVLLFAWAIFRAHQNNLTGTEKPMELAFMSAVQRSETFPPNDPWMSGYSISYYYFGYVMSAMLSKLSGITSTVGFNMTISLLFALTGLTTFGVVYNLVRSRAFRRTGERLGKGPSQAVAAGVGLLGMVFVILMGNFQAALIEIPFQTQTASVAYFDFWDVQERTGADYESRLSQPPAADVTQFPFWWWFRASRVLQDRGLDGQPIPVQPIDEFPQFSFLLADNHPHVLALPFAVLALGLALNLLLTWRNPNGAEIIFYGLCLGGLVFLNTWDGPIYMVVLVGVDAVRRLIRNGTGRLRTYDWLEMLVLGLGLVGVTVFAYLPFFVGFRSQAGGILPNLIFPTPFPQYFVMFGPFVILLLFYLVIEAWRAGDRMNWRMGILTALALFGALLGFMALLALAGTLIPSARDAALRFITEAGGWGQVMPQVLQRRLVGSLTTLVLLLGVVVVVGRLFPYLDPEMDDDVISGQPVTYAPATGFALLLVGVGLALSLIPEFLYLRDNFAVRINTIFKFYYQSWLVFSVASAYAVYSVIADARSSSVPALSLRTAFAAVTVVVVSLGLVYPLFGIHNRMFIESGRATALDPQPLTLDGGPTMIDANDYAAIVCLSRTVQGDDVVIAEAVGEAYRPQYGRVGAITGLPIVLGWENHQAQWRGTTYLGIRGSRPEDIRQLYEDLRWETAREIIDRYGIDYVFYGASERNRYGAVGEDKFRENLAPVCQFGGSTFYRVTPDVLVQAAG